jgi:glucose-6-phosphate-specific signal transduction histidine kinase
MLVKTISQTPIVYIPPLVSETKIHTHTEKKAKIIVWCILIFTFLDSRREEKSVWIEWYQALPEFNLLLIYSRNKFLIVIVVSKYFNCITFSTDLLATILSLICPVFW